MNFYLSDATVLVSLACLPACAGPDRRGTDPQQRVFHFLLDLETQQNRTEPSQKQDRAHSHTHASLLFSSSLLSAQFGGFCSPVSPHSTKPHSFHHPPYIGTHSRRAIDSSFCKKPYHEEHHGEKPPRVLILLLPEALQVAGPRQEQQPWRHQHRRRGGRFCQDRSMAKLYKSLYKSHGKNQKDVL